MGAEGSARRGQPAVATMASRLRPDRSVADQAGGERAPAACSVRDGVDQARRCLSRAQLADEDEVGASGLRQDRREFAGSTPLQTTRDRRLGWPTSATEGVAREHAFEQDKVRYAESAAV